MSAKALLISILSVAVILTAGCTQESSEEATVEQLKHYPLDSTEGVLTSSGVSIDTTEFAEGAASLRIDAEGEGKTVIRLFETGDIDAENVRLTYQARMKTGEVSGKAYLEMWTHFREKGEYFSRGLESPLSGTVDWTSVETPFMLEKGQNPDNVKLNVVVEGTGTVWIDDIKLIKSTRK